jgi:ribosomal-protein-alanine N-acetyltransferase
MPKTHVRHAVSSDFPTLLQIDQDSFPPGIAYDYMELSYFMEREGAHTLVAEQNGVIVGFLLVNVLKRRRAATLVTIDIPEKHRRQGIATDLLATSEEILRKQAIVRYDLQVDVENAGAIKFYEKHGFAVVRRLPEYYSNGNDAFLMTKGL